MPLLLIFIPILPAALPLVWTVAVPLGLMLVLPVTALLLPVAAALLERFRIRECLLLLLAVGFFGGVAVAILVFTKGQFWLATPKLWPFVTASGLAGLVAGWFFARTPLKGP